MVFQHSNVNALKNSFYCFLERVKIKENFQQIWKISMKKSTQSVKLEQKHKILIYNESGLSIFH